MFPRRWAFEDLVEGVSIPLGPKLVTAEEIREFALEYDFQPMHLDEEAGRSSILGGLSASGWHTSAMLMRMICDAFLLESTSQGAPGIDLVQWRRPVLAGDTLSGESVVLSARPSRSKPGIGLVNWRHSLNNQRAETVMRMQNTVMFRMRAA